ncbi:MAG: hypothetical protein F4X25_12525 [Chloroflexi bacterium]|nr:hypothetical protein [Chloroflexota bacterium]
MTTTTQTTAGSFAQKARLNAEFVLAATPDLARRHDRGMRDLIALQPAYQLTVEGLELALKAATLSQGMTPDPIHSLAQLYSGLPPSEKLIVDDAVRDAIAQSSTGSIPFDLPNSVGVGLLRDFSLGVDEAEGDRTTGYGQMDAPAFFAMLDAEWGTDVSQYLGVTRGFSVEKQTLRVDMRILAGALRVCLTLADHILGPEEDPSDYGYVLESRGGGSFVASTKPVSWTDQIDEAEVFDTSEDALEAMDGNIDWIGRRVPRRGR